METIIWKGLTARGRKSALARPARADGAAAKTVAAILRAVAARGDSALAAYSRRFDGPGAGFARVAASDLKAAARSLPPALRAALKVARSNILTFHRAGMPRAVKIDTMPGVRCELRWRPLDTAGIYIPGGSAPLFSTLLMQAIPARIAGCRRIVVCTPPGRDGKVNPGILAAARLCGVTEIYAVGGAQAIAAMAYGTQTIPKVDKIFGPGNAYVTMAKQLVAQDPNGAAIDMPAGPSEVMVIADATARAAWVAADLLAQAEHDSAAQVLLVTPSAAFARKVRAALQDQIKRLSRRAIAARSLKNSRIILAADAATAIEIANLYAPEHLILHMKDATRFWPRIRNAGSVFLGPWTPESAGDYASGTNHVLPTYGYARSHGGLSVISFMKSMTAQTITPAGLRRLAPTLVAMSEAEGLDAHAAAVKLRLGKAS